MSKSKFKNSKKQTVTPGPSPSSPVQPLKYKYTFYFQARKGRPTEQLLKSVVILDENNEGKAFLQAREEILKSLKKEDFVYMQRFTKEVVK
jgi:hypothetical protein